MQSGHMYVAHEVDSNGNIPYTSDEDKVWGILYKRQIAIVRTHACNEYLEGLIKLDMSTDKIPQPKIISEKLNYLTGWAVKPVAALISFREFYELIAKHKFPAASFIRLKEHLEYLQEPDIFHELFGHCPMLTCQSFANFSAELGRIGASLSDDDQIILGRLYWFTIEVGLIKTNSGFKIYGAGILSSQGETAYALESDIPMRKEFDILEVMRRPYPIDRYQKLYYYINSFDELYNMISGDKLMQALEQAKRLGDLPEIT